MRRGVLLALSLTVGWVAGCNPATDVSPQPSKAELEAADQRRAAEAQKRTGLTAEQQANLDKYYRGRAGGSQPTGQGR